MNNNTNSNSTNTVNCNGVSITIPFIQSISGLWAVWCLALIFVIAACVLSFYLIYKHLKFYTQPEHQRYIVRIICMVPLYSVYSLLSLVFHEHQIYFAIARDCYEAYALYMFFKLCVNYAGGQDALIQHFLSQPKMRLTIPLCCKVQTNELFFVVCRQGMLQYVLVRPVVSIWAAILQIFNLYGDGEFNSHEGYLYALMIDNICVTIALYVIVLFEQAASELLHPYRPLLKFLSIKIVIFLAFWQSVIISGMVSFGWIPSVNCWSVGDVAIGLQNFLICFEMFFISLMHISAYPYELYRVRALTNAPIQSRMDGTSVLKNMVNMFNQADLIEDAVESLAIKKKKKKEADNSLFKAESEPKPPTLPLTTPAAIIVDPVPDFNPRSLGPQTRNTNPVEIELDHLNLGDFEDLEDDDFEEDDDLDILRR